MIEQVKTGRFGLRKYKNYVFENPGEFEELKSELTGNSIFSEEEYVINGQVKNVEEEDYTEFVVEGSPIMDQGRLDYAVTRNRERETKKAVITLMDGDTETEVYLIKTPSMSWDEIVGAEKGSNALAIGKVSWDEPERIEELITW